MQAVIAITSGTTCQCHRTKQVVQKRGDEISRNQGTCVQNLPAGGSIPFDVVHPESFSGHGKRKSAAAEGCMPTAFMR